MELFKVMVESEASDLYLTVARPPMYRIEGKIQPRGDHIFTPAELETLVKSIMNESQLREYGENLDHRGLLDGVGGAIRVERTDVVDEVTPGSPDEAGADAEGIRQLTLHARGDFVHARLLPQRTRNPHRIPFPDSPTPACPVARNFGVT